jgi:CelD/BcsL family acetyltransferase involved in cellulose biosynthesis
MTQEKPLAEDSFGRARREFFGTANATPAPSASPAEYLKLRNAGLARKVAAASLGGGWVDSVARSSPHVVSAIDPLQDSRWSTLIANHPRASVFHTPGWLEALRRTYDFRPQAYTTSPPMGVLTDAFLFVPIRSWLTGRRIVSLPFSDHCAPLMSSPEAQTSILRHLKTALDREKLKYVEFRPADAEFASHALRCGFVAARSYYLHRVDLRPNLDDIFRSLDKDSVQRRIRRAERAELTEKCGRSEELLKGFYKLLVMTRKRHGVPPQPYSWFRNVLDCMGDLAEIRMICDGKDAPAAAILTLRFKNSVVYKYGGYDEKFKHLGVMPLLLWRAIENAKTNGATEFDLGRSDENNAGLVAFKGKWAKDPSHLVYWRYPALPRSNSIQEWKLKGAQLLFARTPSSVLTAAGRVLYRHIA